MAIRKPNEYRIDGDVAYIILPSGDEAIVDAEKLDFVLRWRWHAVKSKHTSYAWTTTKEERVAMHRVLTGLTDKDGPVDHINHNGLDNRMCNLRVCGYNENSWNLLNNGTRRKYSKYEGVSWTPHGNKWLGFVCNKTGQAFNRSFDTELEALIARDISVLEHRGEFGRTNLSREVVIALRKCVVGERVDLLTRLVPGNLLTETSEAYQYVPRPKRPSVKRKPRQVYLSLELNERLDTEARQMPYLHGAVSAIVEEALREKFGMTKEEAK